MAAAAPLQKQIYLGFTRRPHQQTVHDLLSKHRFVCAVMHRRAGKTAGAFSELVEGAIGAKRPASRFGYLAPSYAQAKRIGWDSEWGIKRFTSPIPGMSYHETELRVDFPNGSRIQLGGAENIDSWRGVYWDGVVIDEPAQMDKRFWPEIIRPALSDRGGWALFIGTPDGENYFYDLFMNALSGRDPEWAAAMFRWQDTNILPISEIDSARRNMSEEAFLREYECFPPGTMIATSRGNIPIEQIRTSDAVLTHRSRWRPVREVMRKEYAGDLIEVDAHGFTDPLRMTPEHPVRIYDKSSRRRDWVLARDLKPNDLLILPKPARKAAKPILSESFARLIAWYITEGSVSGNAVSLSFNPKSESEAERIRLCVKDAGYEVGFCGNGVMNIHSTELADRLVSWCGSLAPNKRIPFDVIAGHENAFFEELMLGDGCVTETTRGARLWVYTTVSRSLAFDVQLLAAMLRYRGTICTRPGGPATFPGGRVCIAKPSYAVRIPWGRHVNHEKLRAGFPIANGVAWRVRSVSTAPYSGPVFNLSVAEDESYVADGRAVHNCSFTAGVEGAYYARLMDDVDRQGRVMQVKYDPRYPVRTAWDLGYGDATAIWCSQTVGNEVRVLRYFEDRGQPLRYYHEWLSKTGYSIIQDILPHDAGAHELGTGQSREETLRSLGRNPRVLPIVKKDDQIEAVRNLIPRCVFDAEGTALGRKALRHYRVDRNRRTGEGRGPLHDQYSHGADAFAQLAVGLRYASLIKKPTRRPDTRWMV